MIVQVCLITAHLAMIHTVGHFNLVPRPLPDFILQLWRKIRKESPNFSPWLQDKIGEWSGDKARVTLDNI